ncbi:YicC/YloC family endoribonuclease [Polluticaenibacter yanchengensis]|uniref:YicC family protein n=1 Tax=Polluticaenibacter yanchengensis TaxID=3014562 RepID=A0ABT4UKU9_9BACT|nr:YicC family protein [Chitinophagaceae bacterium LY-5]
MKNTLRSMTGFGRSENATKTFGVVIDLKTLNGKQLDYNLKLPVILKPYEFDIRAIINEYLVRGSLEFTITLKQNAESKPAPLNTDLIKSYFRTLQQTASELGYNIEGNIFGELIKLPDVVAPVAEVLSEEEFNLVKQTLIEACNNLTTHRIQEGTVLQEELELRITNIMAYQAKIEELAPQRTIKIKENLYKKITEQINKDTYDENRLEQEIIYYIEKIDITEEMVRLKNHCNYFFDVLKEPEIAKGKKIGFVFQEIGREINTTGSKAFDSDIQKLVVAMKDELEKAKEQSLNIL